MKNCASVSLLGLAAGAGLLPPGKLGAAETRDGFIDGNIDDAISAMSNDLQIHPSNKIHIKVPKIAENGATVPVTIRSDLAGKQEIALFSEKNPIPLVARFELGVSSEPVVQARIKMADSGNVIVIVNAENKLYSAEQFVTVTVGGCGG